VEKEGFWIFYWYNTKLKLSQGNYQNGKKEGLWTYWHTNGRKALEGNFQNGKKEGIWTRWHRENGQEKSKEVYRNGGLKEYIIHNV